MNQDLDQIAPEAKPLARAQPHDEPAAQVRERAVYPPVVDIDAHTDTLRHAQRCPDIPAFAKGHLQGRSGSLDPETGHPQQAVVTLGDDEADMGGPAAAIPSGRRRERIVEPVVEFAIDVDDRAPVAPRPPRQKPSQVHPVNIDPRQPRTGPEVDDHPDRASPLLNQRVPGGTKERDQRHPSRALGGGRRSRARRQRADPDGDQRQRDDPSKPVSSHVCAHRYPSALAAPPDAGRLTRMRRSKPDPSPGRPHAIVILANITRHGGASFENFRESPTPPRLPRGRRRTPRLWATHTLPLGPVRTFGDLGPMSRTKLPKFGHGYTLVPAPSVSDHNAEAEREIALSGAGLPSFSRARFASRRERRRCLLRERFVNRARSAVARRMTLDAAPPR